MNDQPKLTEVLLKPMDPSSKAALVGGAPLATVTVWMLEQYLRPKGLVLETPVAVAFGVIGATFFGELWEFFTLFTRKLLEKIK